MKAEKKRKLDQARSRAKAPATSRGTPLDSSGAGEESRFEPIARREDGGGRSDSERRPPGEVTPCSGRRPELNDTE